MKPIVTACIISYNQEKFIDETLNGAIAQQLNVGYEVVVGDDASTDATPELIAAAAAANPKLRVLPTIENLGMPGNWARTIDACKGQYIALCEGDDVWSDPQKLQKQIDLLERNPKAAACFSNATVINDDGQQSQYPYVDKDFGMLNADDFFKLNFNPIPTCTLVFRRSFFNGFPPEYYQSPFADWILHTLLIQRGDYIYLPESTASYRKHGGGLWSGIQEEKQLLNKLKALEIISALVEPKHRSSVGSAIKKQLDKLLYFYREQGERGKYWRMWLKLKLTEVL